MHDAYRVPYAIGSAETIASAFRFHLLSLSVMSGLLSLFWGHRRLHDDIDRQEDLLFTSRTTIHVCSGGAYIPHLVVPLKFATLQVYVQLTTIHTCLTLPPP
jgi:hypothetical protein